MKFQVYCSIVIAIVSICQARRFGPGGDGSPPVIDVGAWMGSDFSNNQWNLNSSAPLGHSPFPNSILVPSTVRGLSLVCNASYPVEWTFHRERWGGRSRLQYALQSTRFSDGIDVNTFSFSSELSFFSFESNSVSGNYTCQKVGYSGLSSSMYVFWEGSSPPFLTLAKSFRKPPSIAFQKDSGSFILPCSVTVPTVVPVLTKEVEAGHELTLPLNQSINFDPRVGFTLTNLSDPFGRYSCHCGDNDEDGDGDLVTFTVFQGDDGPKPEFNDTVRHGAYYHIDSATKELLCCSAGPKAPKLKLVECDHPTICALAKHTLHNMESAKKRNGSCSSVTMHFLRAGVFRCQGAGIDVVKEYFYPIPETPSFPFHRKPRKGHKPAKNTTADATDVIEPYYDWSEANSLKMMLVTKVSSPVYIGENRTFSCKVSHYYYAQGIVWGVAFTNQTTQYFNGRQGNRPVLHLPGGSNRHFEILVGRNQVYLDITIEKHLDQLLCYAPVWNSTEWGTKIINLDVQVPTAPKLFGSPTKDVTWYLNDTKKSLECRFDGTPTPTVTWKNGNKTVVLNTKTEAGVSTLSFPRVTFDSHTEFQCIISNTAGETSKHFTVSVIHSGSSTLSVVLILSLLGLAIVSIALAFMYKYMKSQKNVMNHLANLAFKDVSSSSDPTRAPVPVDTNGVILPSSPPQEIPTNDQTLDIANRYMFNSHLESVHNQHHHHANLTGNSQDPNPHGDHTRPSSPPLSFSSYQKF